MQCDKKSLLAEEDASKKRNLMAVGEHPDNPVDLCAEDNTDVNLVDDPLFRKTLVITTRMGQSAVCMGKGIALGKRDTTLPHRHTFSRKIIPATDKRLDEVWCHVLNV
jgi:hypothetical protein